MSDNPLLGVVKHLQHALEIAQASLCQYADLQEVAVSAHENSCELARTHCELERAQTQTAAELQACQESCHHLQQQLDIANANLVSLQSALAARKQQAASAHEKAAQAQQQVQTLQQQLSTTTQQHQHQHEQLQEQVQQLQADLAVAHSSRDLLLQQLQQQEAQLQELLHPADATKTAGDDSDEELPATQFDDVRSVSVQQQQKQQEEIQALKEQVCSVLDHNAVLQVRNESLDQQLSFYKLELARLQEQLAAAVMRQQLMQTAPQQQEQRSEAKQSEAQHPSHESKMLHDKAYYKRKYIEIKERYDALKLRQNGCFICRGAQAQPGQQLHTSSRPAGTKQQHETAAEGPGAAEAPARLTATSPRSRVKHSGRQMKQPHFGVAGRASESPAAATKPNKSPDSNRGIINLSPSKRSNKRAADTVGQPSPSVVAAAAKLAAGMTPLSKKRKGSKVPDTAVAAGALQLAAAGAAGIAALANMPQPSALQCQTSMEETAAAAAAVHSSANVISDAAQTAQPMQHALQMAQQQQQQPNHELCEETLPFATGSNSTEDTVRLSQHQKQQQPVAVIKQKSGCSPADISEALSCHVAHAVTDAMLDGSVPEPAAVTACTAKHVAKPERTRLTASNSQGDCGQQRQQQQQQQHSTGVRSPAWRATRGTKSKFAAAPDTAVIVEDERHDDSSNCRKGSRGRSPQDDCVPAAAAGGGDSSAAAGSDSDFECPASPHKQQLQQGNFMQGKAARKQAKLPCDPEEFDLSQEQQQYQLALQDQQQPYAAAAARHNGRRRRGVTPGPQQQRCEQQQHAAENEVSIAADCPAKQQVAFAVPQPRHQKQSAAQRSRSLPNAPAGATAGRSRYTMMCSKPVAAKQHSAPAAAMGPPAEQPGAPVSTGSAAGVAGVAVAGTGLESTGSIENKPPAAAGPAGDYKYQEVVRKKAARELLPAYECEECKKFYSALHSWGAAGGLGLPTCGHAAPNQTGATGSSGGIAATTAAAGGGGTSEGVDAGQQQLGVHQLVQNAGRHRAKWQPPSTPPGFWHIGFTPDVDSPVSARR